MGQKSIFIDSCSCKRREVDLQKIHNYLQENGYNIVHDPYKSDYIILMTCGVTNNTVNISLNMTKKYQRYDAELIVAGCLPDTHKENLKKIFEGRTLPLKNLNKINEFFPGHVHFEDLPDVITRWNRQNDRSLRGIIHRIHTKNKTIRKINMFLAKSFISNILGKNFYNTFPFDALIPDQQLCYVIISRGCNHNCSYCVIKKGIGRLQSKSPEQCLQEISSGLQQGFHSFILDADDIGPYGIDIGSNLPSLLRKINDIEKPFTVRMNHSHPKWLMKYKADLVDIFKQKKVNNIYASVQSGNDRILQLMGRPYAINDVITTLKDFKESNNNLQIGADLIIGFPSETEEEFYDTLNLIEAVDFDYGDIFPFSCHKGIKANTFEPKIPGNIIDKRLKIALRFLRKKGYFAWRFRNSSLYFYKRQ